MSEPTATVVGGGPNGLGAAITLARAGFRVTVREARPEIGGGASTLALMRPDVLHDVGSAVHPMAAASPLFRSLRLRESGLDLIEPPIALAHPFDDGPPALLARSIAHTASSLGPDAERYVDLIEPLAHRWEALFDDILAPLHVPRHPLLLAQFGMRGIRPASSFLTSYFRGERARALLAGISAHAAIPLTAAGSTAFGLVLVIAGHAVGWPILRGGSRTLARALGDHLASLGGEIITDAPVRSLGDLPPADATVLDVTPAQLLAIAGTALPRRYRRRLERYRYGPGVFKMDWVLSEPVPWRDRACAQAGTVHLSGSLEEMVAAEQAPWRGEHPERPFVLLSQPTLFDPTRAPRGMHTVWAYCHVPHGSTIDMTEAIERQIERHAPGFRQTIAARHVMNTRALEAFDANLVGGDIGGGANTLGQLFFRPVARLSPYTTPVKGLYLCSSSTPPGGGVHGMCGFHAAQAVLRAQRARAGRRGITTAA